jgi:hypothetical protein
VNLSFFVALTFTHGDDFALLWFVLGAVRDDDSAASSAGFFDTSDQNSVVQWGKLRSHAVNSFRSVFSFVVS